MTTNQLPLSAAAEDLQRGYAAHVFSMRGALPYPAAVRTPPQSEIELAIYEVKAGGEIEVLGEFPSAPLFAFLSDVALEIRTFRKDPAGPVQLVLMAPRETQFGRVRLLWPTKELRAVRDLAVVAESKIQTLDFAQEQTASGALILVEVPERPSEVHLGAWQIPHRDVEWESGNLTVRIRGNAAPGQLLILTPKGVYRSSRVVHVNCPEPESTEL